jgi:hypothetical protein
MPRLPLCLAILPFLTLIAAKQEDPAKSVAPVERDGRIVATAFCIEKSGVFITNRAAVHGEKRKDRKGGLLLVLNSGTPRQKVVWADIELEDLDLDIALLRASFDLSARPLPAGSYVPLELAENEPDADAASVIGFRSIKVQPKRGPYPASSTVKVRIDAGALDCSLDAGHAGAPVVGPGGNVIGIVGSAPARSNNPVVLIARLRELLGVPLMEVIVPALSRAELKTPKTFEVMVRSFEALVGKTPDAKTQTVELEFLKDDGSSLGLLKATDATPPGDARYKMTGLVPAADDGQGELAYKLKLMRDGEVMAELEGTIPLSDQTPQRKRK